MRWILTKRSGICFRKFIYSALCCSQERAFEASRHLAFDLILVIQISYV